MNILSQTIPMTSITVQQAILAVLVGIIGYIIALVLVSILNRSLRHIGLPELAANVLTRLISIILYSVVLLAVAEALGFSTGSIILGLSAIIGLILGFGLQDTLNNLAAGVWIAASQVFRKGDFIETAGFSGIVEDVGILSTVMRKPDNTIITIPNKAIWGAPIVNYTRMPIRRIDLTIGIAYGTNLDLAVRTAMETVSSIEGVLSDPQPQVVVTELADSSVNLQIRAWVKKENYGAVKEEIIKRIYTRFLEEGIEIPFPQLDVHVKELPK